jgi:cytochrome c-type biogenesis protein CcmH
VKRLIILAALVAAQPTLADSNLPPAYWANRQLPDAKAEAKAQALMEELRCLVCQGQSIADSDAELAGDMRDLVRRRIAAGEKPSAIRAWLIERYGTWISYKPGDEPAAWPLWLAPLALLLAGAWLIRKRIGLRLKR